MTELNLKGLADSTEKWENIDAIKEVFWDKHSNISGPFIVALRST